MGEHVVVTPATRREELPEELTTISHGGIERPDKPPVETTTESRLPQTPIVFDGGNKGEVQRVKFGGKIFKFPGNVSDEDMLSFLQAMPEGDEVAEEKPEPFREEKTIRRHEGVVQDKEGKHISYMDSIRNKKHPKGILTGGVGHRLTKAEKKLYPKDTIIPDAVVKAWFDVDMQEANTDLTALLVSKKANVPDEVFDVLLNMMFNLGKDRLNGFVKMWAAVEKGHYKTASFEMLNNTSDKGVVTPTKWAKQVGNRAIGLADRMAKQDTSSTETVAEEEPTDTLTPAKGGLFEDESGKLFMVDDQGNKTEV